MYIVPGGTLMLNSTFCTFSDKCSCLLRPIRAAWLILFYFVHFFSEGANVRQIFRATSDSTKKFGAIERRTPLHQKLTSKELDQLWNCNSATVHVGTITVPLSILFHTGVILI